MVGISAVSKCEVEKEPEWARMKSHHAMQSQAESGREERQNEVCARTRFAATPQPPCKTRRVGCWNGETHAEVASGELREQVGGGVAAVAGGAGAEVVGEEHLQDVLWDDETPHSQG